jgi:hypothetical protein
MYFCKAWRSSSVLLNEENMKVIGTAIPGVLIIEPKSFGDARGFFMEIYESERYAGAGFKRPFIQDNLSRSMHGVLRGLHLQNPGPQGKLVTVLRGRVLDVAVDVRRGSSRNMLQSNSTMRPTDSSGFPAGSHMASLSSPRRRTFSTSATAPTPRRMRSRCDGTTPR